MQQELQTPRLRAKTHTKTETPAVAATKSSGLPKLLAPLAAGGLFAWLMWEAADPEPAEPTEHSFNMRPTWRAPDWMLDAYVAPSHLGEDWKVIHWKCEIDGKIVNSEMNIYYYPEGWRDDYQRAVGLPDHGYPFRTQQELANYLAQDPGWKKDAGDIAALCFAARDPNLKIKVGNNASRGK